MEKCGHLTASLRFFILFLAKHSNSTRHYPPPFRLILPLGSEILHKVQWCQSNFSSIENIKNCRKRGDFRQKNESIEEMQQFHAPLKGHFWAVLRESDNSQDNTDQVKQKLFLGNFWFFMQIFRTNVQKKLRQRKCLWSLQM
jgi:hypothetical protein